MDALRWSKRRRLLNFRDSGCGFFLDSQGMERFPARDQTEQKSGANEKKYYSHQAYDHHQAGRVILQQQQQQQQATTMSTGAAPTLYSLSQEIYALLLESITQKLVLDTILQHNFEITDPKSQIINLEKNGADLYFSCDNCGRKISGNRFSAHLERCLERKR